MLNYFGKYLLVLATVLSSLTVFSQSSQEPFGKNRIQYSNFKWKVFRTSNFEVFYYGDSENLAVKAATYAEEDFHRITGVIGYTPSEKVKLIVYNSVADLQQSNIGLSDQEIMIGGQTVLVKSKVEVAFKGTQIQLMQDISYGIAYTIINTVMYGGNVKDVVKSSYLLNLPEWFISGAAAYISEDWNQEMDNFMRNKVLLDKLKKPASYAGDEARFIGQSIWNYIGKEYGENNVSNIIALTRAFRNERESIESNLGLPYETFVVNWEKYYYNIQNRISKDYQFWSDSLAQVKGRRHVHLYMLSMNPEATKIAYVHNYKGRYRLRTKDLQTGKVKNISKGGYRRTDQAFDLQSPVNAWQSEFVLSAIIRKRNKLFLKSFDLKSKKQYKRPLGDYRQVYDLAYSQDGTQFVLSADKTGQTDLFLYNTSNNTVTQLTNDPADDLNPVFAQNNSIVFSSNRSNDTLNKNKNLPDYTAPYNLYLYSPAQKTVLKRLTHQANNYRPQYAGRNMLYYLSDDKGIVNVYQLTLDSGTRSQVTNLPTDITFLNVAERSNAVSFVTLYKNQERIFYKSGHWTTPELKTSLTERRALIRSFQPESYFDEEGNLPANDEVNFHFDANEEFDFGQITFESDAKKEAAKPQPAPDSYMPSVQTVRHSIPKKYNNPFSADKVVSSLMIDPIRGLGALLDGGMSDLLGNHRFDAGGFIAFDFRSTKLFGEYRYVKNRIDFKVRYDRQSLNAFNNYTDHRYVLNSIGVTTSYPFSVYHRVSLTPFFVATTFREPSFYSVSGAPPFANLARKDIVQSYEAIRGEYVFDNALVTGINMMKGTRFKMSAEYYVSNENAQRNFGLMFLDFRKYFPVHKELVLATRISYGHYFGNAPKNFLIGGMDNWLLSNREFYSNSNAASTNPLTIDPGVDNSDLLFVRYVTSLRGFKYNTLFGPKYLLLNAELRLPVAQYFYNGTISSNFLRNLQLIGFTDIGTAYAGMSPFTTDNTQNTQNIPGYPFSAAVTNYQSPFLIGYGAGVRTMLFGYYVKLDLGWGLQNKILSKPQLYLTFGYDF
jgi:hypothetical protein